MIALELENVFAGSEMFGRRLVLRVTMCAFTLFHLGQALAPNMQTFLVTRFLTGFFGKC